MTASGLHAEGLHAEGLKAADLKAADHLRAADLTPADLLAVQATLAAGAAPADALREVSCPALMPVLRTLQAGGSLPSMAAGLASGQPRRRRQDTHPQTLRRSLITSGPASLRLPPAAATLVRAMAVAEVVGAPAGPAVQRVLDAVRAGVRLQGLIRIRSAQAVASARFLIGLPLVAAGGLALLDPAARSFLTSRLGVSLALVAGLLIGMAGLWIQRLITRISEAGSQADPLVAAAAGRDPVLPVTVGIGVLAALVAGPAVGLAAATVMGLAGPSVLRQIRHRASGGWFPGTPADPARLATRVTPSIRGGLPTVEGIELIALALSAGVGLAEACRLAARLGPPEVRPALADVAARLGSGAVPARAFPAQLAELANLIDLTHRWGAPTAEALRLLAGDLRDRAAATAEEAAERLTVQLVFPTTLLLVPAFGLLVVAPLVASSLSGIGLNP